MAASLPARDGDGCRRRLGSAHWARLMARFSCRLGAAGLLWLCLWLSGCQAVWSSPSTTLRCPVTGTHKIKPVVTRSSFEDMERYLSVIADVDCFLWYVYLYQDAEDSFHPFGVLDNQHIITWIIDPENADRSELNYTATSPSAYSQVLSKQFWNLGQRPYVRTFFQRIRFISTAFPEQGIWKIEVPATIEDIIAHVTGRTITFQDCFVVDTPLVIIPSHVYLKHNYSLSVSLPAGSNIMVSWSECFPTSAVLVTDFGTFFTKDGFRTSTEIKFPPNIIDSAFIHSVKEVAVFLDHFMILIGDVIYKVEKHKISRLGKEMGLPESGIIGIRSRAWCLPEYPGINDLSDMIIWTSNTVYLQSRSRWYILLTNVPILKEALKFQPTADISILKACFDSLPNEIALLIECNGCISTRSLFLAAVNEQTDKWVLRDFSLPASGHGDMSMEALYSASSSMILWDQDKIYYTYEEYNINGYLKVSGTDNIFSAASEGSTIHQVVIDYYGNCIIKLKNNILFYLKLGMTNTIKLAAWEKEVKSFAFYWIIAGTIYFLTLDGHTINRETYPLKTEVISAVFTSHGVCPYISFLHSVESNVYYIDKQQNVTFWTQIVFLENLGLSTEIVVYRSNLLKQETGLHYEIARGICTKNQTTTFYHNENYADYSDPLKYYSAISKSTGVMTIEMKPSSLGKTCGSNNVLFHINIGCPHSRHLRVKRPLICEDQNFTFIVPRKHTWFKTSKDLSIQYDQTTFGCPIDVHYGDPFRPLVMLYEGDMFIEIVESEYVLWEMNGRTDFFYNATMIEAKCLRYAQSWNNMIYKDQDQDLTFEEIDEIWGPHNYYSCFRFEGGRFINMHDPYEILNHSGINSIIWPQYYIGIYLFRLRILDPNFSFCDLSALFAVRTYGITESLSSIKIAVFSAMIIMLFLGVLVFSYFRYVTIFRTHSSDYRRLPLHSRLSSTSSADELKKEE
ncbi:cation channel sperm-associated auxiliary subunit epsilon-like isoform X2 [Paroedura picta]|uniref:cation channel sperm-associated auxiliary subunit epsilon-like isoform X2 n=1 Tax=Paroedura picta TaxID=143630 RepID=UPI004056CADD